MDPSNPEASATGRPIEELSRRSWPLWSRWIISSVLLVHGLAIVLAALAGGQPPAPLWQRAADPFLPYYELFDLGYSYRFYARPGPTAIIQATLFDDRGEVLEVVRLPDPETRPRLRYQRQLALAYHLHQDLLQLEQARAVNPQIPSRSLVAESYARHLLNRSGCEEVQLERIIHYVDIEPVRREIVDRINRGLPAKVELGDERFYTDPELIGRYPDDFATNEPRVGPDRPALVPRPRVDLPDPFDPQEIELPSALDPSLP